MFSASVMIIKSVLRVWNIFFKFLLVLLCFYAMNCTSVLDETSWSLICAVLVGCDKLGIREYFWGVS